MASSYLTAAQFVTLSPFSELQANELEAKRPGHLQAICDLGSAEVDARLGKRYQRPIPNPPLIVLGWVADIVTPRAYEALGIRPSDEQMADIFNRATSVYMALKEAADAVTGLYDLPLAADNDATGIVAPTTVSYSEHSPFTWRHRQYDAVSRNRRYG